MNLMKHWCYGNYVALVALSVLSVALSVQAIAVSYWAVLACLFLSVVSGFFASIYKSIYEGIEESR